MEIVQETDYPNTGNILFTINGGGINSVAFRIPYWCEYQIFRINGVEAEITIKNGYAFVNLTSQETMYIGISFDMKIQLIEASPRVQENSGRVALQRGPVIYCLEAVDNGDLLRDVRIGIDSKFELTYDDYFKITVIKASGYRRKVDDFENCIYKPVSKNLENIDLKFIPYYGFANRGESEMLVWILKHE